VGQKVNPISFRLGVIKTWDSRWYANRKYTEQLHEDLKIRRFIQKKLKHTGIAKVEIERAAEKIRINIHTSRPGIIIGKRGAEVDKLKELLQQFTKCQIFINILEVRRVDLDPKLVAENVAMQIERRVSYRRAMKKAINSAMRSGAQGIRINCSGRLGGGEIARREWYLEGRVPLHTLRAQVDYGFAEALATYGKIGVKVWIYRGDVLTTKRKSPGANLETRIIP